MASRNNIVVAEKRAQFVDRWAPRIVAKPLLIDPRDMPNSGNPATATVAVEI